MQIKSWKYNGFVIVCLPGGCLVHEEAGDNEPGALLTQTPLKGLSAAMRFIEAQHFVDNREPQN